LVQGLNVAEKSNRTQPMIINFRDFNNDSLELLYTTAKSRSKTLRNKSSHKLISNSSKNIHKANDWAFPNSNTQEFLEPTRPSNPKKKTKSSSLLNKNPYITEKKKSSAKKQKSRLSHVRTQAQLCHVNKTIAAIKYN
jgi:hypothetical protein